MTEFKIPKDLAETWKDMFFMEHYQDPDLPSVTVRIKQWDGEEHRDGNVATIAHSIAKANSEFVQVSASISFTPEGLSLGVYTFIEKSLFRQTHWNGILGPQ